VNLKIPPLRKRPADVMVLAEHFVRKYAEMNGVPLRPIADETCKLLLGYHWKGNVRELENTLHRAVLLATGAEIGPEAILLPDGSRPEAAAAPRAEAPSMAATAAAAAAGNTRGLVGKTVAEVERDLILDTLNHCLGNRTHAANILGISIRTLRNKLKQYGDEGTPVPMPGELRQAAY
jgi:DNA-binding NtrC family response regulator